MNDYRAGRWVGGIGWISAHPVAKVTRKHPHRRGDEVRRGTRPYRTRAAAQAAADAWAATLNEQETSR